jgi:hypothetical protein
MKRAGSGVGSGAGSWPVSQRYGSGSVPKFHGSGTLVISTYEIFYLRDLFCNGFTSFSAMQPRKRQYHDGESTTCTAPFRKGIIPSHPCCWPHNFLAVVIIRVHEVSGVADPDPGCGIRCLFDPYHPGIRDGKKIRIWDPGWTSEIIFPRA